MPGIIGGLHAQPHTGSVAKQLAEAGRDIRRNGLLLAENIVEVLAGNAEQGCDLQLGLAGRGDDILQQCARMGGAALAGAARLRGHVGLLLPS